MGKSSGSTNTIQKTDPWVGQQLPLLGIYAHATDAYTGAMNGQNLQYYPGSTYVPMNGNQTGALDNLYNMDIYGGGSQAQNAAQRGVSNLINNATNNPGSADLAATASGAYVNAANPYQQQMIANTTAQVLPQIESQFAGGDRLDSGLATAAASQGLGNAIGALNYGQYTTEQGLQNQAAAAIGQNYSNDMGNVAKALYAAPGIDAQQQQDWQTGINTQAAIQGDQQNNLNSQIQRWNYNQMLPWQADQLYAGLINGNVGGTTSTQQPYYTNNTANLIGGLAGTASLIGALPSAYSAAASGYGALSTWLSGLAAA